MRFTFIFTIFWETGCGPKNFHHLKVHLIGINFNVKKKTLTILSSGLIVTIFKTTRLRVTSYLRGLGRFPQFLKVHKTENFFDSDLEFVLFLCQLCINNKILVKHFFDWTIMGGATIIRRSLKTKRNEKIFKIGQKNFYF